MRNFQTFLDRYYRGLCWSPRLLIFLLICSHHVSAYTKLWFLKGELENKDAVERQLQGGAGSSNFIFTKTITEPASRVAYSIHTRGSVYHTSDITAGYVPTKVVDLSSPIDDITHSDFSSKALILMTGTCLLWYDPTTPALSRFTGYCDNIGPSAQASTLNQVLNHSLYNDAQWKTKTVEIRAAGGFDFTSVKFCKNPDMLYAIFTTTSRTGSSIALINPDSGRFNRVIIRVDVRYVECSENDFYFVESNQKVTLGVIKISDLIAHTGDNVISYRKVFSHRQLTEGPFLLGDFDQAKLPYVRAIRYFRDGYFFFLVRRINAQLPNAYSLRLVSVNENQTTVICMDDKGLGLFEEEVNNDKNCLVNLPGPNRLAAFELFTYERGKVTVYLRTDIFSNGWANNNDYKATTLVFSIPYLTEIEALDNRYTRRAITLMPQTTIENISTTLDEEDEGDADNDAEEAAVEEKKERTLIYGIVGGVVGGLIMLAGSCLLFNAISRFSGSSLNMDGPGTPIVLSRAPSIGTVSVRGSSLVRDPSTGTLLVRIPSTGSAIIKVPSTGQVTKNPSTGQITKTTSAVLVDKDGRVMLTMGMPTKADDINTKPVKKNKKAKKAKVI